MVVRGEGRKKIVRRQDIKKAEEEGESMGMSKWKDKGDKLENDKGGKRIKEKRTRREVGEGSALDNNAHEN